MHLGGGYILFVDCDDWIEENTVQTMLDAARSKAVDIVQCARSVDKEDGSSYLDVICETELTDQEEILNAFLCFQKEYKWSVWGKLFSKSTVTDMLFNLDLIVGEDAEFNYRIIKSGVIKRFVSINECFYHYCMNVNSVQHASINEQKLVSYAMWKNIFVENPNNEYALWDYTWVGYDFIKSIIASDKCRNYFAPLRKDIKVNIHRIQGSNVFSKKFKLELWLIARLPVAYIAIRKIYSLRGR